MYFASTIVQGFFIRKRNWIDILENGGEVIPIIKKNILLDYLTKIKLKVEIAKKRAIEDFQLRNDHEMIQVTSNKEIFKTQDKLDLAAQTEEESSKDSMKYTFDTLC
jgi:hypothetical protein